MKSDVIDIVMKIHVTTARAILASDDGEKKNAVWLPLSQVEVSPHENGDFDVVTLPEWLAKEKELI